MTDAPQLQRAAIALYDRFTHGGIDRRTLMTRLTALAGSTTAAATLLAAVRADDAAAQTIAESRVHSATLRWTGADGRTLSGYHARPLTRRAIHGAVLVVHENRGLNDHIRDVARRFALAGYPALALDFLSPLGGTPAGEGGEDRARTMIGALDLAQSTRDGLAAIAHLRAAEGVPVAVTGFCWGGAMALRLAVEAGDAIAAAIPFYGPAPNPALAPRVAAPVIMHLAGRDDRVNATAIPFVDALRAAGKPVTLHVYPNVDHAFHNDTSAARYDAPAARLAWDRTLAALAQVFTPEERSAS